MLSQHHRQSDSQLTKSIVCINSVHASPQPDMTMPSPSPPLLALSPIHRQEAGTAPAEAQRIRSEYVPKQRQCLSGVFPEAAAPQQRQESFRKAAAAQ